MGEASAALPYLTSPEHAEVLRLASILLLGFLLPHSTGNDVTLLQNARRRAAATARPDGSQPFDPIHYLLHLPLEERIEKSVRFFSSNEYGEMEGIRDESFEVAFDSFLKRGLRPLLEGRPIPVEPCDLLHVMAMAIHPQPAEDTIPQTSRHLNMKNSPVWQRTKRLMSGLHATQFQIHYGNRLKIVKLVAHCLRLPNLPDVSDHPTAWLLHGPIPHLRAAVRTFGRGAVHDAHVYAAECALVSIACEIHHPRTVDEQWKSLLHTMAEDRTVGPCPSCHILGKSRRAPSSEHDDNPDFCIHAARGRLMSDFIGRLIYPTRIGSKRDGILSRASKSLTEAIEWQVDCWMRHDPEASEEEDDNHDQGNDTDDEPKPSVSHVPARSTPEHSPCLLASLVSAAVALVRVMPVKSDKAATGNDDDDDDPFSTLMANAIQLLGHPNSAVRKTSGDLALSSMSRRFLPDDAALLFKVVRRVLSHNTNGDFGFLDRVLAAACQCSPSLALALLRHLVDVTAKSDSPGGGLLSLLSVVGSNCPAAVSKVKEELVALLDQTTGTKERTHIVATLLCARQVRYFTGEDSATERLVSDCLGDVRACHWSKYKLGCFSMETGNYRIAAQTFGYLLATTSLSEKYYLWLTALEHIATAESLLNENGSLAIPVATTRLRNALNNLHAIQAIYDHTTCMDFQEKCILLRLDFLDLTGVFRQLTKDMRVTGSGPNKHTRPFLHLQNTGKAFVTLAKRYDVLLRSHGLQFRFVCSQSALRLVRCSCLFMGQAVFSCFSDVLPQSMQKRVFRPSLLGSSNQPASSLMRRLYDLVVVPMDSPLDPLIRAAATLELVDGILMVPAPFPKDFLVPATPYTATLQLSPDPEQNLDSMDLCFDQVESYPSLCYTIFCSGQVPEHILQDSIQPCWEVVLRFRVNYSGPLEDEEGDENREEKGEGIPLDAAAIRRRLPDLSAYSPTVAAFSLYGRFFVPIQCPPILDEGMFTFEVQLGCRDCTGTEWEVPVDENSRRIPIRVARTR